MEKLTIVALEFNEEQQAIHYNCKFNGEFEYPENTFGWQTVAVMFDTKKNDYRTTALEKKIYKSKRPMSFEQVCRTWENMRP
jgi:hypothetical protein